jgi:antitoxin (DNA-binding transcriptional repressor) of toxin-antitoxin stability system
MVMIKANVFEVKARLSHYLAAVARGERVVICKRNEPVAELRAIGAERSAPRPVGVIEPFYPADEARPLRRRQTPVARVAERPEKPFGAVRRRTPAPARGQRR